MRVQLLFSSFARLPLFKQWIKSSSILPFVRFKSQHFNNFMLSLDSWDQGSSIYSIILFLGGGFIFPPLVNWWTPSLSHWSYNSVILFKWLIPTHIRCLNIFCVPTWNDRAIYINLFESFLTLSVIWHF